MEIAKNDYAASNSQNEGKREEVDLKHKMKKMNDLLNVSTDSELLAKSEKKGEDKKLTSNKSEDIVGNDLKDKDKKLIQIILILTKK